MTTLAAPPKDRIQLVDGLRGFALFGILMAHMTGWFIAGPLPEEIYQNYMADPAANVAIALNRIFFIGKFYTFFAFMFGLSFALQLYRRHEGDGRFLFRFMWRLVLLFVIGAIHHLHWKGDILTIYALLGFFMIPFRRLPDKVLLVAMLLLVLNAPLLIRDGAGLFTSQEGPAGEQVESQTADFQAKVQEEYRIATEGSYAELIRMNLKGFEDKMAFQFNTGRIYVTLGFFLLGLWAGRKRLFEQLGARRRQLKRSTWLLLALNLAIIAIFMAVQGLIDWQNQPAWAPLFFTFLIAAHTTAMTIFYITGMTLLLQKKSWAGALRNLAVIGKMTLTNYLLQTVVGLGLFYTLGLGLLGKINPAWCLGIGLLLFGLQIGMSRWWLARFSYGPVEWLWRSATYLKWQPLVRRPSPKEPKEHQPN